MKRRLTPPEKKQHEYQRKRRTFVGRASTARRSVPWFESRAKRRYRRRVHQLLTAERDVTGEPGIKHQIPIRPASVGRNSRPVSLRELIERKRWTAVRRTVGHLLRPPYEGGPQRERYVRFFQSLSRLNQYTQRRYAILLKAILDDLSSFDTDWLVPLSQGERWWAWSMTTPRGFVGPPYRANLRAFFADEPEWEARLRAWIASFDN